MKQEILDAIEQTKKEIEQAEIYMADAKAERTAVRKAINAGNVIVMVLESYHGIPWADELGTEATQQLTENLVRREAHLNREIARLKAAIRIMNANIETYEAANGEE